MTDTFAFKTLVPDGGGEFRVDSIGFGDGYTQTSPNGLNYDRQKYTVVVPGTQSYVQSALDFVRAHVGVSFYWTPPLGVQGTYQCKSYKPSRNGAFHRLTLQFEESYLP